jgi:hypothetical protein
MLHRVGGGGTWGEWLFQVSLSVFMDICERFERAADLQSPMLQTEQGQSNPGFEPGHSTSTSTQAER